MMPASINSVLSYFALMLLSSVVFFMINLKAHGEGDIASVSTNELFPEGGLITQSLIDSAMPKLKQSRLGKILTRYYNNCLGGVDNWKKIKSFKVVAELSTENGIQDYESIFKKPNLFKISISSEEATDIIAFDGNKKQHTRIARGELSLSEVTPQMLRMIHEPELVTYLLHPLQAGKIFHYKGTVRESNTVCYRISLSVENGYTIDYFFDVETYLVTSIKIIDKLEEFKPILINYSDYRLIGGVYFAHDIKYHLGGQLDFTICINDISLNIGSAKWMFDLEKGLH